MVSFRRWNFLRHISAPPNEIGFFGRIYNLEDELVDIKKCLGIEDPIPIEKCCGTCNNWYPTVGTNGRCEFLKQKGIILDFDNSPPWIHLIMPITSKFDNDNCNAWRAK